VPLPPGPRLPAPLQLVGLFRRPAPFLERCCERYGPAFTLRMPASEPMVFVADPEVVKAVWTRDKVNGLPAGRRITLQPVLGPRSVLLLEGAEHLRRRRLMLPPFHGERMRRYGEVMERMALRDVERWPIDEPFALMPRMQAITLDVIMAGIFGIEGKPERGTPEHGLRTAVRQLTDFSTKPIAQLGELHSGAFFGEIALVGGTKRTANVIAAEDVWLLEIPARALETAAQKHPQLAEVIAFHARARLLSNVLRTSELFKPLDENVREELLAKFSSELVPQGMTFIRDGEANDALWVIVSGTARVSSGGAAVAELQPGSAVGEMSLVSGAPAGADVTALEPLVLLKLAKKDFDAVVKRYPTVLSIVERLAKTRQQANQQMFQDASDLIV